MTHSVLTVYLLICFLTPLVVLADTEIDPNQRFIIEGAHAISEGAYFRFYIKNNYSYAMCVKLGDNGAYLLPTNSSEFSVIAPEVSFPYQKVTYIFNYSSTYPATPDQLQDPEKYLLNAFDYTVLVLDSGFLTIFDMMIPILIIGAVLIGGGVVLLVFWKRKHERAQERGKTSAVLEEHHESGLKTSDVVLLIAIAAFIIFLAVAVFIILTDTRGLRLPGGGMHPNLHQWIDAFLSSL